MRRCPNPGCPFHVRHGFAAEFDDHVERCRSCATALAAAEPELPARAPLSGPGAVRLGLTVVLILALAGFARVPVPGFEGLHELGVDASFASVALIPALLWLIVVTIFVEIVALVLPPLQPLRTSVSGRATLRTASSLLTLALLLGATWWQYRSPPALDLVEIPSLGRMLLTAGVGLALVLTLAAANDRWGFGQGLSVVVAALSLERLSVVPEHTADPTTTVLLTVAMVIAFVIWLARPSRPSADARNADAREGELGLGLSIPSCGILPAFALALPLGFANDGMSALLGIPVDLGPEVALEPLARGLELVVLVAIAGALAWAFTRPAMLVDRWRRVFPRAEVAALEREARALFRRTALRSALFVVVVQLLEREQLPAYAAAALAAIGLDLARELRLRLRHGELVAVPAPVDVPTAEALAYALLVENRPAVIQPLHHRALYHELGTWLPLRILVSEADRPRAEQLRELLLAREPDQTNKEAPLTNVSGA